jgi:transposase
MPPSLREWLPPDHLVWFVLEVVDQLDTSSFHAQHPNAGPGRRAFDPDLLLAVLLYSYATGERSSRRIETLCGEHVAFQVLCGRDVPDHTVIARFRAAHEDRFAELFGQVLVMCAKAGMGKLGMVAIDGTKIAANASVFANRAEESLRAEARRILAEAASADAAEDEEFGDARGDEVAPEFADPKTRVAAIKAALKEIEAEKKRRDEQADADGAQRRARWQERADAAREELARAEDDAERRVAAWQAAHAAADAGQGLRPGGRRPSRDSHIVRMARKKAQRLQQRAATATPSARARVAERSPIKGNLTDPQSRIMKTRTGWIQGYNAQLAVSEDFLVLAVLLTQDTNDMTSFEPMLNATVEAADQIQAHHPNQPGRRTEEEPEEIGVVLADAGYCSEHNLTIDGPDRLIATSKDRSWRAEAGTDPRTGTPPDASATEQMRHRMRTPEGVAAYARRGATVEPVNAHLKDQVGLRRFSRRGITAAASELNLAAAVANLLKLHRHTIQPA